MGFLDKMKFIDWMNKHTMISYWMPLYAVMAVIAYFSLMPMPFSAIGLDRGDMLNFDVLHIFAYFVLSFLMGVALIHSRIKVLSKNSYILPILIVVLFSGFLELFQGFIPGRWTSFTDMIYNLGGTVVAQAVRFRLKKNKSLDKII